MVDVESLAYDGDYVLSEKVINILVNLRNLKNTSKRWNCFSENMWRSPKVLSY